MKGLEVLENLDGGTRNMEAKPRIWGSYWSASKSRFCYGACDLPAFGELCHALGSGFTPVSITSSESPYPFMLRPADSFAAISTVITGELQRRWHRRQADILGTSMPGR